MRTIGDPQEAYDKACNEYFPLSKKKGLTNLEKSRLYYLFNKIEELEAVYFGNPKGLKICSACRKRIVKGYYIRGIFLERICLYCYKRGGSEEVELKRNSAIGNRHGAKS